MKPKPIEGYGNRYVIFPDGRILRNPGKFRRVAIFIKPRKNKYLNVTLWNGKKPKTTTVHRLLAISFIPNPHNKQTVNHKDGNKCNNSLNNLEWATFRENLIHSINVLGIKRNSEKQIESARIVGRLKRKLTMRQALSIRRLYKKTPRKELSKKYGVSLSVIDKIIQNKTYFDVKESKNE